MDLKHTGSGNLGATNTTLVLGRKAGVFVLIFDVLKSFFSAKLAQWLFPQLKIAGMLACVGAIVGHCFPVTMHFSGGKGLAAFGGMLLAYNPVIYLIALAAGIAAMVLLDIGVAAPLTGAALFPVLTYAFGGSPAEIGCAAAASAIIFYTHLENVRLTRNRGDTKVHQYFRDVLFKRKKK